MRPLFGRGRTLSRVAAVDLRSFYEYARHSLREGLQLGQMERTQVGNPDTDEAAQHQEEGEYFAESGSVRVVM